VARAAEGDLAASVKKVTDIVAEIAAAHREQSVGIEQVNQAVSSMDTVTQQNAQLVSDTATTAQALMEQAGRLQQLMMRFKVDQAQNGSRLGLGWSPEAA
jgi:methyl-accepting chemotaxis protein